MQINLSNKKMLISGIQGTGKTYLAKRLTENRNTLVYTIHKDDIAMYWNTDNYIVADVNDYVKEFDFWCNVAIKLAKKRKVSTFIIDDADLLFRSNYDMSSNFRDIIANHRHYGLTIILITRRLQDIPTRFYGSCEFLALFFNESPQVRDLLNRYYENLGDMVANLNCANYEFILKEIGKSPRTVKV